MKQKINLGKKLFLTKERLNKLNEEQLSHFLGGRMAAMTEYTSNTGGACSGAGVTGCCSVARTLCCG